MTMKIHDLIALLEEQIQDNNDLSFYSRQSLEAAIKELKVNAYVEENKERSLNTVSTIKPEYVQVGAGSHVIQGYMNIDIVPPAEIVWDARSSLPFQTGTVKTIFNEHFLEHIDYPTSVISFLSEAYRVLMDKGSLIIGIPDTYKILKAYIEEDDDLIAEYRQRWYSKRNILKNLKCNIDVVNIHMRDQLNDAVYNPHFWSYDFENLSTAVKDAGFEAVEIWDPDETMVNPKRIWGTLYIKATK